MQVWEYRDGRADTEKRVSYLGEGNRGQKAKEFLEAKGYTNVVNGGGPAVKELWDKFGSL